MHRRPDRKLATLATALAALPLLGGCVQATRHSNTMVFGTNTTFGVKVGTTTGQTPEIVVGYDRQEAVIMPLVANTGEHSSDSTLLQPCDLTSDVKVTGSAKFAVHPCSLVAVNGKAMDSYSVLASFGAQFDVDGQGAKGGLAQYFSTGIAAQLLAATGGASVVATGNAAAVSAAKAPDAIRTIESLYGDDSSFQLGIGQATRFTAFSDRLDAKIELTPEDQLATKMTAFEQAVGSGFKVADECDTKKRCKTSARQSFVISYGFDEQKYESALNAWAVQ